MATHDKPDWAKISLPDRRHFRRQVAHWEGMFRAPPEREFFRGWERMPPPDPTATTFQTANAWWLAELCRLAYTPDSKESARKWNERKPERERILVERTPFREVLSIHKTGNHASIYTLHATKQGTVAEATLLCFRGTNKLRQWMMNSLFRAHPWQRFRKPDDPDSARVHSGFYLLFKRMWPLLWPTLESLPRPWVFSGHSLGGALATIAATVAKADLLCTFGAPKAGNESFVSLADQVSPHQRLVNRRDIVPLLPPVTKGSQVEESVYKHGGQLWWINPQGRIEIDSTAGFQAGEVIPFTKEYLLSDLSKPPAWILDHSMTRYCRKLKASCLRST